MAEVSTEATTVAQPFPPSWIDRINHWVEGLPLRPWLFFLGLGFLLVIIQLLFIWIARGSLPRDLLPILVFNGLFTPYLLALVRLLDRQAIRALVALRPVLDTTDPEFDGYAYRLSNMPLLRPLLAGLAVLAFVILMERFGTEPARYAALDQIPNFMAVFQIIDKSSAFLFGVFVYHTLRQLRLVNEIHANHVHIDLFNVGPVQAFSTLTASTAVGLVLGVYGWMLINPELLQDPAILGIAAAITLLAAVVFVWPLYGVHRLLEKAKQASLDAINDRFQAVFSQFNDQFDREDYPGAALLTGMIASLEIQQNKIGSIPTWPWSSDTLRSATAAIALPLVLMIIQFVIEWLIIN